jgi:hypothetical protein
MGVSKGRGYPSHSTPPAQQLTEFYRTESGAICQSARFRSSACVRGIMKGAFTRSGNMQHHMAHAPRKFLHNPRTVTAKRGALQIRCSRAENRGSLRLYLDTASIFQWEKYSQKEVFFGVTSNSLILQKDDVPQCNLKAYRMLAKKVTTLAVGRILYCNQLTLNAVTH